MLPYDKHYKKENYFKGPCPELIEFFTNYPERGRLCDLGAGQGRDSIPLQKAGYEVTAIDISCVGLKQIKNISPEIKVIEADIYSYDISGYDFILMDSMLHFYKNDIEKEKALVEHIFGSMKSGSVLVNNMIKSKKAQKILEGIANSFGSRLEVLTNKNIDYPDFNTIYHMTAYKKK